jgi:hypothetical protein
MQPTQHAFHGLRTQAFGVTRLDLGLPEPAESSTPWGVIMETGHEGGTATLVAFAEGTASIYLSSGGGSIGGGEQPAICEAAQDLVAIADKFQPLMAETKEHPEPRRGQTLFYLHSDDGIFTAGASESELRKRRHPLSPLYEAAQEIITRYRLMEEAPK